METHNSISLAKSMDEQDPLREFRSQFRLPRHHGKEAIYFLGNSLGLQPVQTKVAIENVLHQWHDWGVEAFFKGDNPWLQMHSQLTPTLAKIVGAEPQEVVVMNSLTVNLHLLLVSFYQPVGKRTKILCEAKAFPSDQYMLQTHVRQRGLNADETIIEVAPRQGEVLIREEDVLAAIETHKDDIALLFWGGVNYYTGQVFNIEKLAAAAHAIGAKVGYDLAHAVGNIPLQLHDWNVDFAAWCSYKYLNSGPGGMGGAYVHERYHNDALLNRFGGWWGVSKQTQFLMEKDFMPDASAEGWNLSTPSPVLYASQKAALAIVEEAGLSTIFEKSRRLTSFLWEQMDALIVSLPKGTIKILTPQTEKERGCQLSIAVKNGKQVFDALTNAGVFADWREPDVIRVAPVALYNTFEEVAQFAKIFKEAVHTFAL